MCLAIPGKVEEVFDADGLKMAKINFGGIHRSVCLEYTPEALLGDYVLTHVGFAISVIDADEAARAYALLQAAGEFEQLGSDSEIVET